VHGLSIGWSSSSRATTTTLSQAPGWGDPLVVDLCPEALGVDRGRLVADRVHAAPSVGAADNRHEFARGPEVVGGDELDERMLWRAAAEERDDVLAVARPGVLAHRLTKPDLHATLGARRAHE